MDYICIYWYRKCVHLCVYAYIIVGLFLLRMGCRELDGWVETTSLQWKYFTMKIKNKACMNHGNHWEVIFSKDFKQLSGDLNQYIKFSWIVNFFKTVYFYPWW